MSAFALAAKKLDDFLIHAFRAVQQGIVPIIESENIEPVSRMSESTLWFIKSSPATCTRHNSALARRAYVLFST
jgi:hypothetical protein